VDRQHIDADPDPNFHVDADSDPKPGPVPILMRILPQVLHILENVIFFSFSQTNASLKCFTFIKSVKGVIIFRFSDRILKTFWKFFSFSTISFDWNLFVPIRIRQNDTDLTQSGYTTLVYW
jgi:hypothetical protein